MIGIDIVKVKRIEEAVSRHGESFLKRVFTPEEIRYCESQKKRRLEHYAARFAAKEAFYKAVSPSDKKIRFSELGIHKRPNGAPEFVVSDSERKRLSLSSERGISVSLSHDTDYAVAVVTLS